MLLKILRPLVSKNLHVHHDVNGGKVTFSVWFGKYLMFVVPVDTVEESECEDHDSGFED